MAKVGPDKRNVVQLGEQQAKQPRGAAVRVKLLDAAEASGEQLLFAVIVGASSQLKRHRAWAALQALAAGPHGRAQWHVPLHLHGYTEGHAHILRGGAREAARMSSCDTAVVVLASTAGAARWPATEESEGALRHAMRGAIPRRRKHKTSKANAGAHRAAKKAKRAKRREA